MNEYSLIFQAYPESLGTDVIVATSNQDLYIEEREFASLTDFQKS
jgi:hypothetical protein